MHGKEFRTERSKAWGGVTHAEELHTTFCVAESYLVFDVRWQLSSRPPWQ